MCDVLTPNQFEAGLLTGLPVTTEQEALVAAEALHATGPCTVVRGAGEQGDTVVLGVMAASMCNVSARTSGALQFITLFNNYGVTWGVNKEGGELTVDCAGRNVKAEAAACSEGCSFHLAARVRVCYSGVQHQLHGLFCTFQASAL